MELVYGTHEASESPPQDVINSMPEIVVTHILDRLPIKDAVRTCILSRTWRSKWTLLTQFIFDNRFLFYRFIKPYQEICNDGRNLNRLFLHLKGPITKFVLLSSLKSLDDDDFSHWFMFLSRVGIYDFTLKKMSPQPLKLPIHLFSCRELKHLKLNNCYVNPPPSFRGFPNLLSLDLNSGPWEHDNCEELITLILGCPLLEILILSRRLVKVLKLVHISKLGNLRVLSLALSDQDNTEITSSSIFQLMDFSPKLEELNLDLYHSKLVMETGARKRLHTAFNCLKTLRLSGINFCSSMALSATFKLIWSCPNLQTLELNTESSYPPLALASSDVDYDTMGPLQHLRNVVIRRFRGSDKEVCLLKVLLSSSPLLKKIVLYANSTIGYYEELKVAKMLLMFPRASSIAEVELH